MMRLILIFYYVVYSSYAVELISEITPNFFIREWSLMNQTIITQDDLCCYPYQNITFQNTINDNLEITAANWIGSLCDGENFVIPVPFNSSFDQFAQKSMSSDQIIWSVAKFENNATSVQEIQQLQFTFNIQVWTPLYSTFTSCSYSLLGLVIP